MTRNHPVILAAFLAALMSGSAGFAQDRSHILPGTQVQGSDGEIVGTIEETQDDAVVVNIGNDRALISLGSLERTGDEVMIHATRDDLNRMIEERRQADAARRDEFLTAGRLVRSVDRKPVGRIVAIEREADSVVILRNEGVIALRPDHFAVVEDRLVALFTRAQIDENTKPVPEALRQRLAGMSAR